MTFTHREQLGGVRRLGTSRLELLFGRTLIELRQVWRKGQTLEPDWQLDHGYRIRIDGRPEIHLKMDLLPPPDFEATTLEEFMVLGHIMTATPPINAIPAVVAAAPGIVTYNDLPLILPRGVVPVQRTLTG